jgi:hypothetical protein
VSLQRYFPVSGSGVNWDTWNGSLLIYFGEEPIPQDREENWKWVAKNVIQLPTFSAYPMPNPDAYANWQDWANDFTQVVNGPSNAI